MASRSTSVSSCSAVRSPCRAALASRPVVSRRALRIAMSSAWSESLRAPSSSTSRASRPTRNWRAASRLRPASRSARARRSRVSQASSRSRPPRTAARRCCGWSFGPGAAEGARAARGVDGQGEAEVAVGQLLAAAEAEADGRRALAGYGLRTRVAAGNRLGVEGSVDVFDRIAEDAVEAILVGYGRVEPGTRAPLVLERLEGPDDGDAGEWKLGRRLAGARLPGLAPPAPARRRGTEGLDHQHPLAWLAAQHVAAVGDRHGAGKVELDESEEAGQRPNSGRRLSRRRRGWPGRRRCRRPCRRAPHRGTGSSGLRGCRFRRAA